MKELPYYKFFPAEWIKGDITICSMEAQGLFINICSYYWMKGCNMSLTSVQQRFNGCSTGLDELIKKEILGVSGEEIMIDFLDEQFEQFEELAKKKSRAGKASAKKRGTNTRSTGVKHVVNKEDKDKDKDKEEDIKNNKRRFTPPTPDQVIEYCKERGKGVDPNKWYNHYTANGWKVGKNPMKDWKASVRTWEQTKSETWDVKKEDQSNFENL